MQKKHRRLISILTIAATLTWAGAMGFSHYAIANADREIKLSDTIMTEVRQADTDYAELAAQITAQQTKIDFQDRRRATVMTVTGWDYTISDHLIMLCDQYGISVDQALGVISNETGGTFDSSLVGRNSDGTRDHGLMQINDGGTLQWLGELVLGTRHPDPYNAISNLSMGMWYLHYHSEKCGGDWECTKSRYNGDSTGRYASRVAEHTSRMGNRLREAWVNSIK